ncbi:hypothetical protein C3747_249g11 [Trypanosoma cruzi]|uniref:Leucyl/phenylalanyl-tRNA protein transferase n=2 Tax=Trypanosoma cruzi TaxID=5693 RepID=Q4DMU6_TRYCC|nr:hypothetical protein, conserved [Trypanosoma cruzi]EAN93835.1 hypothetical protein, conserved [Trypanosoma cruzi]PWU96869.1 hypothetical protein C3747_249g11 [Trypanosoma cruzi]|eukprot:XP_815686.1 hypothetical protein [Trypanosoma cruzi strain CL Brener]
MGLHWRAGENYLDVLSLSPFTIHGCQPADAEGSFLSEQKFPLHARFQESSGEYMATLWALDTGRAYLVGVGPSTEESSTRDKNLESCLGVGRNGVDAPVKFFIVKTCINRGPLAFLAANTILDVRLLYRDDFLDCLLSQRSSWMLIEHFGWENTTLLQHLFYHSLFAIPDAIREAPVYTLPNGSKGRFCLDLKQENIAWRKSKKVRRIMLCDLFAVAVNRDIRDSLCLAREYHLEKKGNTWLKESYIDLLVDLAACPEYGVKIMSVELLEKSSGNVLAGCLGFSLGCVHHDFTMFTMQRSPEGFGTFATKLLGEALQQCGYNLWYWGFRLKYMEQFEGKYGGKIICKADFFARWAQNRDVQPNCTLEEFFRSGRGMLPYFVSAE